MNCKTAELYMNALLDDELPVKDSLEIVDHIESCKSCKEKWELNEETRSKFKHFIGSIKVSESFRKKIYKNLKTRNKIFYLRSTLIAAVIIFLIGLGFLFSPAFNKLPSLYELHNKADFQLVSSDINLLSNYVDVKLKSNHLSGFQKADFIPYAAFKTNRKFNQKIGVIALQNKNGQKISLCFLPENYKLSNCHKMEIDGTTFYCGKSNKCHFAYWKQGGKTIALVSDRLTSEEMIELAIPLAKKELACLV